MRYYNHNEHYSYKEKIEKIDKLLNDEKNKDNIDINKILKLKESKMFNLGFNDMSMNIGKYKLPW